VVVDHGQQTTIEAEVERYDPYDGLTARLEARGFVSRVDYDLAERDGRTRVACTVETDVTTRIARLLAPLVTRQAQRAIATSLTTLKQLLEA
jgi:carbon monoxide dehydrogenase subunit G